MDELAVAQPEPGPVSWRACAALRPCRRGSPRRLHVRVRGPRRLALPNRRTPLHRLNRHQTGLSLVGKLVTLEYVGSPVNFVRARPRSPGTKPPASAGRIALAQLLDADQVARGIAEGAVTNAVRLLDRLLDDLGGVAGLQPLEGAVEVLGGQEDPA